MPGRAENGLGVKSRVRVGRIHEGDPIHMQHEDLLFIRVEQWWERLFKTHLIVKSFDLYFIICKSQNLQPGSHAFFTSDHCFT